MYISDPDSSSEEDSESNSSPRRDFFYEEDIFEESQDETNIPSRYTDESMSESMEYAEDELESMSKETFVLDTSLPTPLLQYSQDSEQDEDD